MKAGSRAETAAQDHDTRGVAAVVAAAWNDVLADRSEGSVDPDRAFLSAGGHSLAAARLIARLRGDLAVDLPMSAIVRDDPTLTQLVAAVTERLGTDPGPSPTGPDHRLSVPPADAASASAPSVSSPPVTAPLAPTMRRIWTWHRLHPDSPAYNVVRVLGLAGQLRPAVLRAALADLTDRHEALRCAVTEPRPGKPEVVLADDVVVPLSVEVVRDGDGGWAADLDRALRRLADQPFAMDIPPLWRVGAVWVPAVRRSFLVLIMHHLISDMRTTDLVLTELAEAYAARAAGAAPVFPAVAPSLLAHLRHEQGLVGTPGWRDDLAWWSARLSGASPAPPLPLSAAERDELEFAATTHTVELPAEASEALDDALRSRGLTPALLFLTAAGCVLSAWSGQERAEVVGLPSVRISRPEDERLVGFLLDTLPLPFAPDRRHGFGHCYQALRDAYSEAADHARPAFDDVVERLRLPRSARSPLIRLWFSDLTQAVTPAWFGDLHAIEHDLPPGWALFDLGFYLWRGPEGYRLHLVSPRDLCAPADTAELLQQVVAVATRAAADPERSVAELLEAPSVAAAPITTEPAESTVDLVRRHAERRAGPAVADQEGGLDYHTMDAQVDAAAAELEPGTVVVLPARRDRRFLVRLLACWRAGATAVLVDAGWPAWRRRRALETSGATRTYPWSGDGPATAVPGAPAPAAPPAPDAGHVLFTSGTTGDPLAVRVPAPVADTALADLAALLGIEPTDRVAMLSVAAHDPVLRDLGLALRTGATVCVPPPDTFTAPDRLTAWLRQERVSVLSATPTLLALMLAADPAPLPDVRVVISGGSPLSRTTAALVRRRAPAAVLVNGYGCTETPQLVIAQLVAPEEPVPPTAQVPIGRPLPGRRCEVRTEDGRRCDAGQLGELWVAAPHIAQGYLDDPTKRPGGTPGRFVTDGTGARWLRTGDLARRDAAGRLHLAGRRDRQVLVNGYRVTLEELESVARACAGVSDAVAEVVGDGGGQAVRVWVQRSAGATVGEDVVRAHIAAVLPVTVVPARVIMVDRLAVGETLKPNAPQREPEAVDHGSVADGPVGRLAAAVLGRPLEEAMNFFDAGFTSLSLLQLSAELSDLLQRPVEPLTLFQHPNLRALGAFLSGAGGDETTATSAAARSRDGRAQRLDQMRARRHQARRWASRREDGQR